MMGTCRICTAPGCNGLHEGYGDFYAEEKPSETERAARRKRLRRLAALAPAPEQARTP